MLQISKMSLDDLNQIIPVLTSDFDDFWKPTLLQSEFENTNSQCIVLKSENEIVGFGCIWKAVDVMHITNIVVKKNQRQQGYGCLLLKELINISTQDNNITSITLEVNKKNIPAQHLYEKNDFIVVGKRKKYYGGVDDAIIMTMEVNK